MTIHATKPLGIEFAATWGTTKQYPTEAPCDNQEEPTMKKWLLGAVFLLLIAFVMIQFIPVDRTNPPVLSDIPTEPEVKAVLQALCYDCHSHETVWPWYSRIAPVSWRVAKDVHKGREELNFSMWDQYTTQEQVKKMRESLKEVAAGEMPPWFYTPTHRGLHLSAEDRMMLRTWADGPL